MSKLNKLTCQRCRKGGDCSTAGHLGLRETGATKRLHKLRAMSPEERRAHRKAWKKKQKEVQQKARETKALKFVENHSGSSAKPKTKAYVARLLSR